MSEEFELAPSSLHSARSAGGGESDSLDWSDYDEFLAEELSGITEPYQHFAGAILDIEKLLEATVAHGYEGLLWRLLYANVVMALETYLSDAFISTVVNRPALLRRFVETNPDYQKRKVQFSEIPAAAETLTDRVTRDLFDLTWHDLARVIAIYRATLDVEFEGDHDPLFHAIMIRHDIVHRNGKTKDGRDVYVGRKEVTELILAIDDFVQGLDVQLSTIRDDNSQSEQ